jgi:hypothetical protein
MPIPPFSSAPTTNASLLTSGTLADARLSANVPLIASSNSFTAGQSITPSSVNSTALTLTNSLTGSGGASLLLLTPTWNTSITPTALKVNVTDTASGSGSLLLDLQVGAVTKFNVTKFGTLTTQSSASFGGNISVSNGSAIALGGGLDCNLYRDGAANILAQRNGTNAQTTRIYGTYTDASNYERGFLDWTSNTNQFTIGTAKGGTGTARRLNVQSAENIDFNVNGGSFRTAQFGTSANTFYQTTHVQGPFDFIWNSSASDPTAASNPFNNVSGTCAIFKNTTTGLVKLWVNDGGTMKSVTLV